MRIWLRTSYVSLRMSPCAARSAATRSTRISGPPTLAWSCSRTSGMADPGLGAPPQARAGLLESGCRRARPEGGDAAGHQPQADRHDAGSPGEDGGGCLETEGSGLVGRGAGRVVGRPPPCPGVGFGPMGSRPPEDRMQGDRATGLDGCSGAAPWEADSGSFCRNPGVRLSRLWVVGWGGATNYEGNSLADIEPSVGAVATALAMLSPKPPSGSAKLN